MNQAHIARKKAVFQSEGRLLQELGERLVASAEVAIVELIKNAYDADSPICYVCFEKEQDSFVIEDQGHGMTEDEFLQKWMRIATGGKLEQVLSRRFERKLTGAKGIGRFAVRFLGSHLRLSTVSYDENAGEKRRLCANFDWTAFDDAVSMEKVEIPYDIFTVDEQEATGTRLEVTELSGGSEVIFSKKIRSEVLKMTSPVGGLERGRFSGISTSNVEDPGFQVTLPVEDEDKTNQSLAEIVLGNHWGRVTISLEGDELNYAIYFSGRKQLSFEHSQPFPNDIKGGLFADIRFFPYRAGVFSGKEIDGRQAWKWVRDNSGVGIVDHGFRVKPYGYVDDDWLGLSQSEALSERDWRSPVMQKHFPMSEEVKRAEKRNPMLNLPKNHQLVGAVFIDSSNVRKDSLNTDGLIPSMDREGFRENETFRQLRDIIRGGIEMLAWQDKIEIEKREQEEAKRIAQQARAELREAIKEIEASSTLTSTDKKRIISGYRQLSDKIEELDAYHKKAREGLEMMALLGVVAGFMTHESRKIMDNLKSLITKLKRITEKDSELNAFINELEQGYGEFSGHVSYASTFINAVQNQVVHPFKVFPQIKRILRTFGWFSRDKNIEVSCEIDDDLEAPSVPVALYSGIVLNLYTNALKAVMAGSTSNQEPKIVFKSWNEPKWHVLEVADNGIGVPPHLRERIWDPLFTTTSSLNNPLGSGMGLGLTLIKKLLKDVHGTISLVEAPPGFSTCFRILFQRT